jgi:predicted Fe-Mo cluster-binding NifX family protein
MKIAVTSQNFKSVTGHAGTSRRFIIFEVGAPCDVPAIVWLDLPMKMSFHAFSGGKHPLDDMDVILTANASQEFVDKLAQRGIKVITCDESDPRKAVRDFLTGVIKPAISHDYAIQMQHKPHGAYVHSSA